MTSNASNSIKAKPRRPRDEVWTYYSEGERNKESHTSAKCNFCDVKYSRADISVLKGHLANHCQSAPGSVIRKYQTMLRT
jgi:hypothetical protein